MSKIHLGTVPLASKIQPRPLGFWLLSLATLTCVAAALHNPGSLDAYYHFHVAKNLTAGRSLVEDVIWNYLDKSDAALALPHASHLYWMPLTTWMAWLGIEAFEGGSYLLVMAPWFARNLSLIGLRDDRPLAARAGRDWPVRVLDPPGFTLATGRQSIVVPSDGPAAVRAAADRFGARWLLLESDIPALEAAWRSGAAPPGFVHVREFQDALGSAVHVLLRTSP